MLRGHSTRAAESHATAPIDAWLNVHAATMLVATMISATLNTAVPIAVAGAFSFAFFGYRHRHSLAELRPYGGYANLVTACRLVLVLGAALLLMSTPKAWLLLLFFLNVVMDVVDGRLARSSGQATRFGAVFDREADALFVLVAYVYFFLQHAVAAWILIPGLLPYLYRLATPGARSSSEGERKARHAAALAGTNYVVLLVAIAAAAGPQLPLLIFSAGIVSLSFLVSFWNLYRDEHSLS